MQNLAEKEIKTALRTWIKNYEFTQTDSDIEAFLSESISSFCEGQGSWLKRAREGLFLSADRVARKLGVSRAAYSKYEANEKSGAISLATLARAAEALDCELVYAIRPKNRKIFSEIIWNQLIEESKGHTWVKSAKLRKGEALAFIMSRNMADPAFRRKMNWSLFSN